MTGSSHGGVTGYDYATIKYSPDGDPLWVSDSNPDGAARYDGPGHSTDIATAMVLDAAGNVYVTGWSTGGGTGFDFATIKYSQQ